MIVLTKFIILIFGFFLICIGFLMLFNPKKAHATLRKAGSTNLINYMEITIRMIPAIAMILYADFSKFPEIFRIFGWFMIATSLILFLVPRKTHHKFSLKCADILKPDYFRLFSPIAVIAGIFLIYSVL